MDGRRSPIRETAAGSAIPRTIVASSRTATARPKPSSLLSANRIVAKIANTATITIAALVTVPAVAATPSAAASRAERPFRRASRIRSRTRIV